MPWGRCEQLFLALFDFGPSVLTSQKRIPPISGLIYGVISTAFQSTCLFVYLPRIYFYFAVMLQWLFFFSPTLSSTMLITFRVGTFQGTCSLFVPDREDTDVRIYFLKQITIIFFSAFTTTSPLWASSRRIGRRLGRSSLQGSTEGRLSRSSGEIYF